MPRGRWDDGAYVSIERSDAYEGLAAGLYIVVVASGDEGSAFIDRAVADVRARFSNMMVRSVPVYVGCMH